MATSWTSHWPTLVFTQISFQSASLFSICLLCNTPVQVHSTADTLFTMQPVLLCTSLLLLPQSIMLIYTLIMLSHRPSNIQAWILNPFFTNLARFIYSRSATVGFHSCNDSIISFTNTQKIFKIFPPYFYNFFHIP